MWVKSCAISMGLGFWPGTTRISKRCNTILSIFQEWSFVFAGASKHTVTNLNIPGFFSKRHVPPPLHFSGITQCLKIPGYPLNRNYSSTSYKNYFQYAGVPLIKLINQIDALSLAMKPFKCSFKITFINCSFLWACTWLLVLDKVY